MLPYSPLHHLLLEDSRRGPGDDERERLRRADRLPGRGRARAAGGDRGPVPPARSADRDSHRRLRASRGRRGSPALPAALARLRPRAICRSASRGRSSPVVPSSRTPSASPRADRAWVGHHIGDLKNYETLRSFTEGIEHFESLFAVEPELVAHDLHPEYLSTKYALEREGVETVGVQHHHAHLASCLAEHREYGPAIGAIFDGTGYGTDGTVWGGEILAGRRTRLRARRTPAPGADAGRGARHPPAVADGVRLAARDARLVSHRSLRCSPGRSTEDAWGKVARARGERARLSGDHERRAAVRRRRGDLRHPGGGELRGTGRRSSWRPRPIPRSASAYPLPGTEVLDARETIGAILADLGAGVPIATVAARFHNAIAPGRRPRLRRDRGAEESTWSCSPAASSRTACCSSGQPRRSSAPACESSSRGCFRRTTAGSRFGQAAVAAAAGV